MGARKLTRQGQSIEMNPASIGLLITGALVGWVLASSWLLPFLMGEVRWLAMVTGGALGALWGVVIIQGRRIAVLEERLESAAPSGTGASIIRP